MLVGVSIGPVEGGPSSYLTSKYAMPTLEIQPERSMSHMLLLRFPIQQNFHIRKLIMDRVQY
jgi:hypothetical protein